MPVGGDYRQEIVLALQAQGMDQLSIVKEAIAAVKAQMEAVDADLGPREYIKSLNALGAELKKLMALELELTQVVMAGKRERADALAREERGQEAITAALERFARAKRAAGHAVDEAGLARQVAMLGMTAEQIDRNAKAWEREVAAMGERARAHARTEAQVQAQIEATRIKDIEAMGDRARAHARTEAQVQAQIEATRIKDIEAMGDRARAHARAEQTQERLNAQALADRQKYHSAVIAMAQAEAQGYRNTATATVGAAGALGGFATQADKTAAKGRDIGFGMMSIAYAMDDIRYGVGAVINNVPMLASAFGASPAWAAGISIVSIAVYELGKALAPVATQYMRDMGLMTDDTRKLVVTLQDAKDKLAALESKPYKFAVDFQDIDRLKVQVEEMEARLAASKGARRGDATQEMAKQAKDVSDAYAGGSGNLVKAVAEGDAARGISHGSEYQEFKVAQAKIDKKSYQDMVDSGYFWMEGAVKREQAKIDKFMKDIQDANFQAADLEVGAFLRGDPEAIKRMQRRAKDSPGSFAQVGPGGMTTAEAIRELPESTQDVHRRQEVDASIKWTDEEEKERSERFKKRKQKEKAAKDKAAQAEVENIRHEQQMKRDMQKGDYDDAADEFRQLKKQHDAAENEGVWQIRNADRIKREQAAAAKAAQVAAAKGEREAPILQKRQAEMGYGQEFQARARRNMGVFPTGAETEEAGKKIKGLVDKGTDVNTAMAMTFREMRTAALKVLASQEEMLQIIGPATMELRMIGQQADMMRGQIRNVGRNVGRGATLRPALAPMN